MGWNFLRRKKRETKASEPEREKAFSPEDWGLAVKAKKNKVFAEVCRERGIEPEIAFLRAKRALDKKSVKIVAWEFDARNDAEKAGKPFNKQVFYLAIITLAVKNAPKNSWLFKE